MKQHDQCQELTTANITENHGTQTLVSIQTFLRHSEEGAEVLGHHHINQTIP